MSRLFLLLVLGLLCTVSARMSPRNCVVERNAAMFADPHDRSAYYICIYGRAEKFYCPPGYRFDELKPACLPKRTARHRRDTSSS